MASENVAEFYKGKNIFITGGTGFVGVCLLEKILRCVPDVGKIYLLMRPKKGKEIKERLEEIKSNSVFEKLNDEFSKEDVEKVSIHDLFFQCIEVPFYLIIWLWFW